MDLFRSIGLIGRSLLRGALALIAVLWMLGNLETESTLAYWTLGGVASGLGVAGIGLWAAGTHLLGMAEKAKRGG